MRTPYEYFVTGCFKPSSPTDKSLYRIYRPKAHQRYKVEFYSSVDHKWKPSMTLLSYVKRFGTKLSKEEVFLEIL